jgi:hypothetical protein
MGKGTRVPARRRRAVLVGFLGVLAIAASVGLAPPASAGDDVCVNQPWGGGCVTGTRHLDGTVFDGFVADLHDDNLTVGLTIGYMEFGPGAQPWQWTDTYYAHKPGSPLTNIYVVVPVQAEWMVLEACREDFETGERDCEVSRVVAV